MNQTDAEAIQHVNRGRVGCLAGPPSIAYLETLRRELYLWLEEVEAELARAAASTITEAPE